MKFVFNKKEFIEGSQSNWIAPQFDKLKEGELGEWLILLLFIPTFGLFWYPLVALCSTKVTFR